MTQPRCGGIETTQFKSAFRHELKMKTRQQVKATRKRAVLRTFVAKFQLPAAWGRTKRKQTLANKAIQQNFDCKKSLQQKRKPDSTKDSSFELRRRTI